MEKTKKNLTISSLFWKKFQRNQHQLLASLPALSLLVPCSTSLQYVSLLLVVMHPQSHAQPSGHVSLCPSEALKVPAPSSALKLG